MNPRVLSGAFLLLFVVAGCGGAPPAPLSAALVSSGPAEDFVSGGSIDVVSYNEVGNQVTIEGWHMLTPKTKAQKLSVLAEGAVSVASVTSRARPDVVNAVGDEELLNSGFVLVLELRENTPLTRLCIMIDDSHYGSRLLAPHLPEFPSCLATSTG